MKQLANIGIGLLVMVFLLTGCRKVELPEPVGEEAPFRTVLLGANGVPLYSFDVNQQNYYLFTDYGEDALGVSFYEGRFAQLDCGSECGPSLRIQIREQVLGASFPDSLLFSGAGFDVQQPVDSMEVISVFYRANCTGFTSNGSFPGDWSVGGNIQAIGQDTFSLEVDSVLNDQICFTVQNPAGGCNTTQCRSIDPLVPDQFGLAVEIQGDSLIGGVLETSVQGGQGPYTYLWSDGSTTGTIFFNNPGTYCVTVTDATGTTSTSCADVPQNPFEPLCVARFSYETELFTQIEWVPIGDTLGLGQVVIELIEPDGTVLRSDFGSQGNDATLVINQVLTFANNEQGQRTRRIIGNFSCTLYDENGENPLEVETEGLDFAVAIP